MTRRLRVTVPLHFIGKAKGVADGGILQPIVREMEVECLPTTSAIHRGRCDDAGDSRCVHLADVTMPANVSAVFETNEAVVTVLPPTVEEVKTAAVAEGEVDRSRLRP